jgi:rRNA maturation protein Nop10
VSNIQNNQRPARPWDLLNPKIENVPEKVRQERYSICESCEMFNTVTKTCVSCGCFMALKTKLPHAFCPKNKWGTYQDLKNTL